MPVDSRTEQTRPFKIANWVPILGTWKTEAGSLTYTAYEDDSFKAGMALSQIRMTSGLVRATVEIKQTDEGSGRILFGYDAATRSGYSAGLGGFGRAFVLNHIARTRAREIQGVGTKGNLAANHPYVIEVMVRGTNVQLRVEGVTVLDHNLGEPLVGNQTGVLAYGEAEVKFSEVEAVAFKPRVFVVVQFTEPYNSLWEEVIKPVAERIGLEAYRADDVFQPGIVLQDIVRGISNSQAIIAAVTPRNPNVYYELGYAHAVGTPTILLAEQPSEGASALPFDISGFRCIFYDDAIRGKRKVEAALEKHLRNILERSDESVGANGHGHA